MLCSLMTREKRLTPGVNFAYGAVLQVRGSLPDELNKQDISVMQVDAVRYGLMFYCYHD